MSLFFFLFFFFLLPFSLYLPPFTGTAYLLVCLGPLCCHCANLFGGLSSRRTLLYVLYRYHFINLFKQPLCIYLCRFNSYRRSLNTVTSDYILSSPVSKFIVQDSMNKITSSYVRPSSGTRVQVTLNLLMHACKMQATEQSLQPDYGGPRTRYHSGLHNNNI